MEKSTRSSSPIAARQAAHVAEELPLISVVTVVYNGEKFLEQTIRSVIGQTYSRIEYILVDGGSTDRTLDIVRKYQTHLAYWVSEPDGGIYEAWNKALRVAKGEWICFIGADDFFWDDRAVESIVPHLRIAFNQNVRYVYGQLALLKEESGELIELVGQPWEKSKERFRYVMNVPHCGSFHHKTLFEENGSFDSTFVIAGDYDFLLREFKNSAKSAYFAGPLTVVGARNGGISASLDKRLQLAQESQLARKKNGVRSFSREIFFWLIRIRFFLMLDKLVGRNASQKLADLYRRVQGKGKRWSG